MPEDCSTECEDFISRLLDPDVSTRITIPEIREHILMTGPKKEVEIFVEEL